MIRLRQLALVMSVAAMNASAVEKSAPTADFMVVLRETEAVNKPVFGYVPSGPQTTTLPSGEKATLENAWFDVIGDMHIRFVIDGQKAMRNLYVSEFASYGLTPERAVDAAIEDIRTRYGEPKAHVWKGGVMTVSGDSPDFDSSYFLDRHFWKSLLQKYPEGLIAGVPARGTLIFAPVSDAQAVTFLSRNIQAIYQSAANLRISSGLYLYGNNGWTVYQKPVGSQ